MESTTFELLKESTGIPFSNLNSSLVLALSKRQKLKNLFHDKLFELTREDNLIYQGVLELLPNLSVLSFQIVYNEIH